MTQPTKGNIFPVMCLVAGTCIGGGMLALPVATGLAGFWPALVMMVCTGTFMAITGLLFVEANLWMPKGAHFMTMAQRLLGPVAQIVVVILFLFIGYASLVAYTAGGGDLIREASYQWFGYTFGRTAALVWFAVIFGVIIVLGRWVVGRINAILFVGMALAYLALIIGGASEVSWSMLVRRTWSQGGYALPLLLTIFSYQAVVPSLVIALDRDARKLRTAIIGGMVIAWVIYALWLGLIFGVVPLSGPHSLEHAYATGIGATGPFRFHMGAAWISSVAEFFAFFALVTSFLGIGLGMYDFLTDSLRLRGRLGHRAGITLLVVVPSLAFALFYPRAFLVALDASGGFGDAILNGMIPVLMVWSGRYVKELAGIPCRVGGGRALLVIILLCALVVLGVELFERLQILTPVGDLR